MKCSGFAELKSRSKALFSAEVLMLSQEMEALTCTLKQPARVFRNQSSAL